MDEIRLELGVGGHGWAEEWGWGCSVWLESWYPAKVPLAERLSGA